MASADDRAAYLLERLLTDPVLRAQFRRDPAAVAREAQLEELAGDFSEDTAMETLEARESRSSLAGVLMAAALEGVAGLGITHSAAAASGHGLSPEVRDVLASHPEARSAPPSSVAPDDLVTPEGAASERAASQPDGPWTSSAPGQPGDNHVEVDQHDGGGSEGEEEDEDEDEGGAAWDAQDESNEGSSDVSDDNDAADEATHDQDSGGDRGDVGAARGAAPPSGDPGPVPDEAVPLDEDQAGDALSSYPGDDKPPAEIAAWMGREARRRSLPAELPVMASLVESGMRNLGHGDRDSVGFFQMRVGIWNNGAYQGYPDRPELQLKWFLDKALEVKAQRVAQGRSVTDRGQYGEWIADVERPDERFRGRYQPRLEEASGLLADRDATPGPDPDGAGELVDAVASDDALRAAPSAVAAIAEAREHLGTPYRWGGSSPQTGFDCSGLVQWAYAKAGIRIPRTTETQFAAPNGAHVARRGLIPGDVVFFRDPAGSIHHEGIYLGDNRFLHAPHTGDVVKVSSLDEPYYAQQFAGGRRFARGVQAAAEASAASRPRGVSPGSVTAAMAAVARDADEARRPGTIMFEAVRRQEILKNTVESRRAGER